MRGGRGGGGRRKGKDRGDKRARARGLNGGRGTCVLTEREEKNRGEKKEGYSRENGREKKEERCRQEEEQRKVKPNKDKTLKKGRRGRSERGDKSSRDGGIKGGTRDSGMELLRSLGVSPSSIFRRPHKRPFPGLSLSAISLRGARFSLSSQ